MIFSSNLWNLISMSTWTSAEHFPFLLAFWINFRWVHSYARWFMLPYIKLVSALLFAQLFLLSKIHWNTFLKYTRLAGKQRCASISIKISVFVALLKFSSFVIISFHFLQDEPSADASLWTCINVSDRVLATLFMLITYWFCCRWQLVRKVKS